LGSSVWITPGLEATIRSDSMEGAMAMEKANVPKVLWVSGVKKK